MTDERSSLSSLLMDPKESPSALPTGNLLGRELQREITLQRNKMVDTSKDVVVPKSIWGKLNYRLQKVQEFVSDSILAKCLLSGIIVAVVLLVTQPDIIMHRVEIQHPSHKMRSTNSSKSSKQNIQDSSGTRANEESISNSESKQMESHRPNNITEDGVSSAQDNGHVLRKIRYGSVFILSILTGAAASFLFQ